ncbi:major facilitator superfamily domain-containing protein [Mrakia frigida]|uniref:major facilitator superfamily domain-containing protein n=1 Tax=Mrakia frigida TaxID=29902 RepID=UPI003FCBF4B8
MTTITADFPAPIATNPKVPSSPSPSRDGSGASSPTDEKKSYADVSALEADEITLNDVLDEEERKKLHQPIESYEGFHRYDPAATWTPQEEKKIVNKIDLRIMTLACLLFFALQLDRGNIGSALSDNMLRDIGINTNDYNNGMAIFYCCFLFAELPSQLISKRIGAERMIPIQVCGWSIVTICQSLIHGKASFFATRALLGLCEGGLIPDTILFLSYFYTTSELPIRLSFFWATLTGTNIVQAFMAAGILRLRGVRGWEGWRYLFVIEGALTLSIGIFAAFWLPASPTQTAGGIRGKGWFSEREEVIMVNRVIRDDPSKGKMHNRQALSWSQFKACLTDFDNWPLYLIGLSSYQPFAPPASYLTLTLRNLGFNTFHTNLLVIPSSVFWIINCFALTLLSRKLKERTFVSAIAQVWGLILLIALTTLPNSAGPWTRYAIISLLVSYPYAHPILVAWNSTNANSVRLRTVSASLYNISVQIGSIVSTQVYRDGDKPYYHKGNKGLIATVCYNLVLFGGVKAYFIWRNRQKKAQWKALTKDEKVHYAKYIAPEAGNKSLLFEFKH